jgi:hypothetical protein
MNGEFASVRCKSEPAACSTETTAAAMKATVGQRFSKAWAGSWKSLARMWVTFTNGIQRILRECHTAPAACRYPV